MYCMLMLLFDFTARNKKFTCEQESIFFRQDLTNKYG